MMKTDTMLQQHKTSQECFQNSHKNSRLITEGYHSRHRPLHDQVGLASHSDRINAYQFPKSTINKMSDQPNQLLGLNQASVIHRKSSKLSQIITDRNCFTQNLQNHKRSPSASSLDSDLVLEEGGDLIEDDEAGVGPEGSSQATSQEQYKHHKINLKQIHQQNAKSQERPHGAALSNTVQLKGKMNKAAQQQQVMGGTGIGKGGVQGGKQGPGAGNIAKLTDEQVYALTRSQEPPMNRNGKNNQSRGQNKGNQEGTIGIKQLVLEDPIGNSKVAMPPISNTMKKTQTDMNERAQRQEQKIRQQLQQRQNILAQLREDIFGDEKTRFGNIICNAFWGFWPTDDERYINPKMEDELIVFKKKIKQRFDNKDISPNFQFPRIGSQFHSQLQKKYSLIEEKSVQQKNAKSQEREVLDRDMLMTLWAQPGYLNSGKIRNQSQQPALKQNTNANRLKNPTSKTNDQPVKSQAQNRHSDLIEYPMRVEIQGTQVDIAELPEDVQKKVIEHLIQKSNKSGTGDLVGDNMNPLNRTDFVQISDLFSPSQKANLKDQQLNQSGLAQSKGQNQTKNIKNSSNAPLSNSHSKVVASNQASSTAKGIPKLQNYVKNADRQVTGQYQSAGGGSDQNKNYQGQQLFQNVQISTKGQNQQQVQSSGHQASSQGMQSDPGYQITQKKKMQSLQPTQNQMKKNAQQQIISQTDQSNVNYNSQQRGDQSQLTDLNQSQKIMSQQQYNQAMQQQYQQQPHDGARKLADSVKILNSEKKKAREGMPLNSHSAMQYQYQSHKLMSNQFGQVGNNGPLDYQQKQRFKDSNANKYKQQQRGSSHEMGSMINNTSSQLHGSNYHPGAKIQAGTQKINIAEIMSPITNANIQAPTSKKSRSGANASNYNTNSNIVSVTHRNVNSQLSQPKRLQQMSRNSRAKLSKQSNYSTAHNINNNGSNQHNTAVSQMQQQTIARSASNHRTAGPKQKLMNTTASNINKTSTTNKSSLTLMKMEEQKHRSDQISINSGQHIQIDSGINGNLNNQMNLACNSGNMSTNIAMVKGYQQYTQKHKDLNRMAFSQLDFGLTQAAGSTSVQQKIPQKKKPLNQSHQFGIMAPSGGVQSSSHQISAQHYATSAASRSNHESIQLQQQQANAINNMHHNMTKKTQDALIAGNQSPERIGGGQFNNFGQIYQQMSGSGQYASQGSGLHPDGQIKGGITKSSMQQSIHSNQKQNLGKSPYKHKVYNTSQQKVSNMQQKSGGQSQHIISNLRSHVNAVSGLSQSQSALKTQMHGGTQNEDSNSVQRTMTQISSKQQQSKLPQGSIHRQSSKESSKPSHRSHRSRQSQTQHAGSYNTATTELTQEAKQRIQQNQIQMARNQHTEIVAGLASQKAKRVHNTQRAQNYAQKQFYTTQQFTNLASSQASFVNAQSNPQIILSHQTNPTKNISSSQQRKNLQLVSDISGHKTTTTQLKPTNIAAKAIMNSDGRQRSRNPTNALQGHTQSHNALLTAGGSHMNPQGYQQMPGGAQIMTGGSGIVQANVPGDTQAQHQQMLQQMINMSLQNKNQRPVSSTQRSNIKSIP